MRLALAITVFDGLELLKASVDHHKSFVDEIIICYQKISNTGKVNMMIDDILANMFKSEVTLVEYKADTSLNPKENERRKHQLMIDTALDLRCDGFIMAAVDHFYNPHDILVAKLTQHEDVSFTKMFTYYKYPTWQLTPIEDYYMPFLHLINKNTKIINNTTYPVLVDPSVRTNLKSYRIDHRVMMHHYSMVRINIKEKLDSSASRHRWKEDQIKRFINEWENYDLVKNQGIEYFQGRKIKIVPNYFNL